VIAMVEGTLAEKLTDRVVVSAGGVGYEALVTASTLASLPAVGSAARIYTRAQIRDDSMVLYGFSSPDERDLFDVLIKVNGVGPKFALGILSTMRPDDLRRAILAGDVDALTMVPGIGKKVAARLVLDLKDRIGGEASDIPAGPMAEVREALLALGLSPQETRDAMSGLDPEAGVEEMLRQALKAVGR